MTLPLHAAVSAATILLAGIAAADLPVHIYSSPDPDSVNSYAVETDVGLVVISTQRTFSEAQNALTRFARTGEDIAAIVIPVPHTDHFGGLSVFRQAWPNAPVYASPATIESLRTDGEGYIASRKAALGDDFPSQDQVIDTLPDQILQNGDALTIGGVTFDVIEVPNANAPSNTLLHVAEDRVLFGVEVIEDGVTAFMKDADLDQWIAAVEALRDRTDDIDLIYGAHNAPVPAAFGIEQQLQHLTAYRDAVDAALADDGALSDSERETAIAAILAAFPDHAQVARLPVADLVGANLTWQAERRGGS